jgi:transcriptional regulator with XRE-family HTH domain
VSAPDANAADPLDVMIGLRVRVRRKSIGMSQTELGNRLGVTFQQVQKYERGANRMAGSTLIRAAQALESSVSNLLGESANDAAPDNDWAALAAPGAIEMVHAFNAMPDPNTRAAFLLFAKRAAGPEKVDD